MKTGVLAAPNVSCAYADDVINEAIMPSCRFMTASTKFKDEPSKCSINLESFARINGYYAILGYLDLLVYNADSYNIIGYT